MGSNRNEISGGVFFSPVVQAGSIESLVLPLPTVTALAALPPAPAAFVGRTRLLQEVLKDLRPRTAPPRPPRSPRRQYGSAAVWEWQRRMRAWGEGRTLVLLSGPPGVGKTALALRVGQEAETFGWYRHQLYLDLRSYEHAGFRPDTSGALGALLRALGVRADGVGRTVQERSAQYRSRMRELAGQGHPVLVVLDNAASREQVEALLPPHARNCTLVVGRRRLSGGGLTGARQHDVPVFDGEESVVFLQMALSRSRPGDERAAEVTELRALAETCGHLALALDLVAAELVAHPHTSPAALRARLRTTATGLLDLGGESGEARGSRGSREAGPGAGSPTASDSGSSIGSGSDTGIGIGIGIGAAPVRSAFDLSYDRLTPEQARLFRLAALHPAASFHAEQAAALEGAGADETAGRLRALAAASLLTETGRHDDRYRYHDLLRGYARERTEQEDSDSDRREAVRRLLRHYAHTAGQADAALRGALGPDSTRVTARFADRASARRWFDAERPALVGAVQLGAASGFPAETAALAVRLTAYFDLRKRWDEWTATYELASDCARQTGDRAREGLLLGQLGRAYAQQRRYDEALIAYGRSRAAYRAAGDARGAQLVLGRVLRVLQDTRAGRVPLQEAIRRYERAADGLRETDDGDAVTLSGILNNLGNLRFTSGSYDRAAECHARVLRIHEGHGDRRGAAQSLVNLGNALLAAGAAQRAAQHYERAAKTFHEIDDRYGQAQALENLGLAHLASGQVRACRLAWRDAAACFAEAGHTDETERLTAADRSLRLWRRKRAVPALLRRAGQNYKVPQETWDTPPKTTTGGPAHRDHPPARTRSRAGAYDSSAANDGPAVGTEVPQADNQDVGAIPGAEPGGDDHGTATTHVFDAEGGEPHEVAHEVSYEGGEDSWHDDLHGGPDDEHIDLDHEFPVADFSHDQDTDQGSDADDENEHDWDDD